MVFLITDKIVCDLDHGFKTGITGIWIPDKMICHSDDDLKTGNFVSYSDVIWILDNYQAPE